MKFYLKVLCSVLIFTFLFSFIPFEAQCKEISDKVFRIHILANSDSAEDQSLKLKVRDAIIRKSEELLKGIRDKETAMQIVGENLDIFARVAGEVVTLQGFDYPVKVTVRNLYFDTRYYGDITMPSGFYDALQVSIGSAKGRNWWCVMYPSLCLFAATDNNTLKDNLTKNEYGIVTAKGKYKVKFKVVELFSGFLDWFS